MKTKTRVILTTAVALLLLLAAIAAGLNAIFTVTLVSAEFEVLSREGAKEAEVLKTELDRFVGKSTTFLDLDDIREVVEENAHFRVETIEKHFPKTVSVKITERKEVFAVATEGGYAVLDEEGRYLSDKETNENRMGGENILLEGFAFSVSPNERLKGAYAEELYEMLAVFSELMPSVRANVLSVKLVREGADHPSNYRFVVSMREGVKLVLFTPSEGIALKTRRVLLDGENGYLSPDFPYEHRLFGAISASDLSADGTTVNVGFSSVVPVAGI